MMKRLTAALLLLFALTGIAVPIAQAASLAPNHACCLRKTAHQQCHGSRPSDQLTFHGTNCCDHNCCRAVTISQSANPQPRVVAYIGESPVLSVTHSHASASISNPIESRCTRGPPFSVIA